MPAKCTMSVENLASVLFGLTLGVAVTEHDPSIEVVYRLGFQGIYIEERLTSMSCEYDTTWQKQEWNLHETCMGHWSLRRLCGTGRLVNLDDRTLLTHPVCRILLGC